MKPYGKSTTNQEELFNIIRSLETLGMNYRITTNSKLVNGEIERSWDIDELVD